MESESASPLSQSGSQDSGCPSLTRLLSAATSGQGTEHPLGRDGAKVLGFSRHYKEKLFKLLSAEGFAHSSPVLSDDFCLENRPNKLGDIAGIAEERPPQAGGVGMCPAGSRVERSESTTRHVPQRDEDILVGQGAVGNAAGSDFE